MGRRESTINGGKKKTTTTKKKRKERNASRIKAKEHCQKETVSRRENKREERRNETTKELRREGDMAKTRKINNGAEKVEGQRGEGN